MFNLKANTINDNARIAQTMIKEILERVEMLQKVVNHSTKKNINLLSVEYDEDIKVILEEVNESIRMLSDELVYSE
jgi:archaellum component FlaC